MVLQHVESPQSLRESRESENDFACVQTSAGDDLDVCSRTSFVPTQSAALEVGGHGH